MSTPTPLFFDKSNTFESLGLDRRIFKAIAKQGYIHPTLIQSKCISIALEGKDILAKAATGSGKTLAYAIPVVQSILTTLDQEESARTTPLDAPRGVRCIVVVPTRELAEQVTAAFQGLLFYCRDRVSVLALSPALPISAQIPLLKECPSIIVATPSRLAECLSKGAVTVNPDLFRVLVLDEADLVLSYGYSEDVEQAVRFLPKLRQTVLMSATLTPEVDQLKALVMHCPAIVKLEEEESAGASTLSQFFLRCPLKDKLLVIYALLRLSLIRGKTLFFVNSVEMSYRTKLFLEQFGISSAVLNHELPFNSRLSIIDHYNRGQFDYLIATDESIEYDDDADEEEEDKALRKAAHKVSVEDADGDNAEAEEEGGENEGKSKGKKSKKKGKQQQQQQQGVIKKKGQENVSRGIDFHDVKTVVNIDFPLTVKSYTHRAGRTARANKAGEALSLVGIGEEEALLETILKHQRGEDETAIAALKELPFNMNNIEAFRYRVDDVKRGVTKAVIREARLKEIKLEMLNSERLKAHFEDNPREKQILKHDKALHALKVHPHLKHVPSYLVPANADINLTQGNSLRDKRKRKKAFVNNKHRGGGGPTDDVLKTLNIEEAAKNAAKRVKSGAVGRAGQNQVFSKDNAKVSLTDSTAGRRKWKRQHLNKSKQGGSTRPLRKSGSNKKA